MIGDDDEQPASQPQESEEAPTGNLGTRSDEVPTGNLGTNSERIDVSDGSIEITIKREE